MVLVVWPLQANGTLCIRFVSHSLPLFLVCLVLFTVWAPHVACSPPCHQQQQQEQPCGWVCVIGGVPVPSVGVGGGVGPSDVWSCCRGLVTLYHCCMSVCCPPSAPAARHSQLLSALVPTLHRLPWLQCYCCCWCCVEWLWVDHTYKMHLSRIRVHCFLWSTRRCTIQRSCSTHTSNDCVARVVL